MSWLQEEVALREGLRDDAGCSGAAMGSGFGRFLLTGRVEGEMVMEGSDSGFKAGKCDERQSREAVIERVVRRVGRGWLRGEGGGEVDMTNCEADERLLVDAYIGTENVLRS